MHYFFPVKGADAWPQFFEVYRIQAVSGGEVITGRLLPGLSPETPDVRRALQEWEGTHESREREGRWDLLLFRPRDSRERWWLHALLFVLTLFSTMVAGGLLAGLHPIGFTVMPLIGGWWLPLPVSIDWGALAAGTPFGISLVLILLVHESGHYLAARYYRISVSPPYFIPFPPYVSIIGTLGAFIRLRSPLMNRKALLDVGVAGPLASFFASLPVLWWGLAHSPVVGSSRNVTSPYLVRFLSEEIWLGASPLFSVLAHAVLDLGEPNSVVLLHPMAFAGWLGLFVTALNLLPISQLDGGHILYATVGSGQRMLAMLFFLGLLPLGYLWAGWWVWAALVFFIGRGRIGHPPIFNADRGLSTSRMLLGIAAGLAFVACFVPIPFRI